MLDRARFSSPDDADDLPSLPQAPCNRSEVLLYALIAWLDRSLISRHD